MNAFNVVLAYIDPGTGSFVFQMLVAGVLTFIVMLRNARQYIVAKLSSLIGRKRGKTEANVKAEAL